MFFTESWPFLKVSKYVNDVKVKLNCLNTRMSSRIISYLIRKKQYLCALNYVLFKIGFEIEAKVYMIQIVISCGLNGLDY